MKNIIKLKFWAFLVFLFCFVITASAIPKLINLEGKLTNSEGIPLYGNFNMTFRIYNAASGGTLLWEEKHEDLNNVTTSNTGIFSVLLGSITELNLNFTEDYWLEIQVKDEVLSPRQRVASSGYTYMTSRLECSSMFCINYSNGNVGIGTTTPTAKLDVQGGPIKWGYSYLALDQDGSIELGNSLSSGKVPYIDFHYGKGTAQDYNVRIQNDADDRLKLEASTVYMTGNVGIGTIAPAEKLELVSGGNIKLNIFPADDTTQGLVSLTLTSRDTGGNRHTWKMYTAPIGGGYGVAPNSVEFWEYPPGGGALRRFAILKNTTTSPSVVVIDGTGNVGIGTTSPNTALDLNGALSFRGISTPSTAPSGQGRIYFDSTTNKFKVSENSNAYVDLVGSKPGNSVMILREDFPDLRSFTWELYTSYSPNSYINCPAGYVRWWNSNAYYYSSSSGDSAYTGACYNPSAVNDVFTWKAYSSPDSVTCPSGYTRWRANERAYGVYSSYQYYSGACYKIPPVSCTNTCPSGWNSHNCYNVTQAGNMLLELTCYRTDIACQTINLRNRDSCPTCPSGWSATSCKNVLGNKEIYCYKC
ncbi:MAG: hypothetical protein QW802_03990 [Candidatus Altiarchaeota archaeon]